MSDYKRYYLENRYIFITVVTYDRINILIENIDLLRNCFKIAIKKFDFEFLASVVLPDHFHIIIKPNKADDFSKIIGFVKRNFTQNLIENFERINYDGVCDAPYFGAFKEQKISESRKKRNEKGIWQRRYYEHTIRDEDDLNKHLDYIHYNPVKHKLVKSVKDWEYSSFHKFVEKNMYELNWGSNEEARNCCNLYND